MVASPLGSLEAMDGCQGVRGAPVFDSFQNLREIIIFASLQALGA